MGTQDPTSARRAYRVARAERGQSMVELALMLPLLCALVLIIVDAGRLFGSYSALANAAREGARYCSLNKTTTAGALTARVTSELGGATGPFSADVGTLVVRTTDNPDAASWTGTSCVNTAGNPVGVEVTMRFAFVTPFIGRLANGACTPVTPVYPDPILDHVAQCAAVSSADGTANATTLVARAAMTVW
jgi:Flp pilus assembly protein TadG